MFLIILGIVIWILIALWPAYLAKQKGHSFILYFLLGIITSWLISLIVVLFLKNRNETPESIAANKAASEAIERETHSQ